MGQEATLSIEESETLQQLQQARGEGLPTGQANAPTVPEGEEIQDSAQVDAEAANTEAQSAETFEYDGQVFASEREAFEYMKGRVGQLETERLLDEARMEGRTEALQYIPQLNTPQAPEVPAEDEIDMDKFYENPSEFLKEYGQKIYSKVRNELTETQKAAQRDAEVWNDFTSKYPDLADFREDVEAVARIHADTVRALASRNQTKAMEFVATKTREKFQRYVEAMKPTRVLSNNKGGVSVGGNPTVTANQNKSVNQKPLDFTAQLRSIRKR